MPDTRQPPGALEILCAMTSQSRLTLFLSVAIAAALTACGSPKLLIEANQHNLRQARTVATAFYHEHGQRAGLEDIPFVTVGMEAGPGFSYDVQHNVLFVTPAEYADFDTQKFFNRASLEGTGASAYNSLVFEYFTAHQMMHLLYDELPVHAASHWDEEMHINTMTWLFLRRSGLAEGKEAAWLTTLANLEGELGRRYPNAAADANLVPDLRVDDNASYWFVTASSLQQSYRAAMGYETEGEYITELLMPADEAQAAR